MTNEEVKADSNWGCRNCKYFTKFYVPPIDSYKGQSDGFCCTCFKEFAMWLGSNKEQAGNGMCENFLEREADNMTVTEFVEDCLPSVTPERPKGKWIKTGGSFRCSECLVMPEFKDIRTLKYCPNCGAYMGGANE